MERGQLNWPERSIRHVIRFKIGHGGTYRRFFYQILILLLTLKPHQTSHKDDLKLVRKLMIV